MFVSAGSSAKKPMCGALFLCTVLMIPLLQVPFAHAEEFNAQERTLQFLSDVAMIDLSKYNVTLRYDKVSYDEHYWGAPVEEVLYRLQTDSSAYAIASCTFINGIYKYCLIGWNDLLPIYTEPQPNDFFQTAKVVLERYQAYVGSNRYQPLIDMLDPARGTGNVTAENLKLTFTVHNPRSVGFRWHINANGAETKVFSISLHDGALYTLGDDLGLFTYSDAEVTVTREEAVAIAVEQALNISWTVTDNKGNVQVVKAEGIANVAPTVWPLSMNFYPSRDPFTFYPYWRVDVWLDKTYPGGVFFVEVYIWADTGEIFIRSALGGGGGAPSEGPADSSTPDSTEPTDSDTSPDVISPSDATSPPSQPQPSSTPDSTGPPDSGTSPDATSPPDSTPPPPDEASPFSTTWIVVIAIIVGVVSFGLVAYFLRRKGKRRET